jgi:alkanesulfonate monooxygenase SsuD/methylene tetrahydromethanopterin reductase-like flavin-dependent oxidoreductase (luciferase family)
MDRSDGAGSSVRWSLKSPGRGWTYDQTLWLWKRAEELGFHAVFHNDHLYGSALDSWQMLGVMFAQTRRIRGGTMVTSNSFRHPTILAKMSATVDIISDGRLILGLGTGNHAHEYATYGLDFPTPAARVDRLEEACRLLKAAWSGEPSTMAGRYYQLSDATFAPRPIQRPHPRLVLGVKGDRALRVAVGHADEWNWNRSRTNTEVFFERMDRLDQLCDEGGREPATLSRGLGFRRVLSGFRADPKNTEVTVALMQRAIRRGASHIVLMLGDAATGPEEVDFLHQQLIPAVLDGV